MCWHLCWMDMCFVYVNVCLWLHATVVVLYACAHSRVFKCRVLASVLHTEVFMYVCLFV